jgi:hypothetical protein
MITASLLTLAGSKYGNIPKWDMKTRAKAAADAGIAAIGVSLHEPINPDVLKLVNVPELEWVDINEPITDAMLATIEKFRSTLGCRTLNVGACDGSVDPGLVLHNLRLLSTLGMAVCFEPVAFGPIPSVKEVADYVKDAHRSNVGMLYDMWHVWADDPEYRVNSYDVIKHVNSVQVCGVPEYHNLLEKFSGSQNRPLVSDSATSTCGWLAYLRHLGYTGPVSYECPHNPDRPIPLVQRARIAAADLSPLAVVEGIGR